jgi:hypothetical protein
MSPDIVNVVLNDSILVSRVRADSVNGEITLNVIDDIRRVVDVPHSRGGCSAEVLSRDRADRGGRCSGNLAGRSRRSRSSFSGIGDVETLREVVDDVAYLAWQ